MSTEPPLNFNSRRDIAFECCTYRTWTVERDTRILADRSDTAALAFRVRRGTKVEGLTGVVVTTRLGRLAVRRETTLDDKVLIKPTDSVYVLRYVGEGYWKFWVRGIVGEEQLPEIGEICNDNGKAVECAVQIVELPQTTWWAKIRNSSGAVGWTREIDHFGKIDACG
jgi:hypothetical protein